MIFLSGEKEMSWPWLEWYIGTFADEHGTWIACDWRILVTGCKKDSLPVRSRTGIIEWQVLPEIGATWTGLH